MNHGVTLHSIKVRRLNKRNNKLRECQKANVYTPENTRPVLTLSLDISVGPKIMAILGTPILFTVTNSTTLKQSQTIQSKKRTTKAQSWDYLLWSGLYHGGKGKICIRANVAHQAGAYLGFSSVKRLGVILLPPGWDASPSQGYPPALNRPISI